MSHHANPPPNLRGNPFWRSPGNSRRVSAINAVSPYPFPWEDLTKKVIPYEKQDEPIRAYKGVNLGADMDWRGNLIVRAFGVGITKPYTLPDDTARCHKRNSAFYEESSTMIHDAPDLECSCGFYATKHRDDIMTGGFNAEVDLFGKVIECTEGYRAEKQRVISMAPSLYCGMCTHETRYLANCVAWTGDHFDGNYQRMTPMCWKCAKSHEVIPQDILRNAVACDWVFPWPHNMPKPERAPRVIHSSSNQHGVLDLPAELRRYFQPGGSYQMTIPICVNAATYFVARFSGDGTGDGFRMELDMDAYRVGMYHFQVPADAQTWDEMRNRR